MHFVIMLSAISSGRNYPRFVFTIHRGLSTSFDYGLTIKLPSTKLVIVVMISFIMIVHIKIKTVSKL